MKDDGDAERSKDAWVSRFCVRRDVPAVRRQFVAFSLYIGPGPC